jgi:hypothetical protein
MDVIVHNWPTGWCNPLGMTTGRPHEVQTARRPSPIDSPGEESSAHVLAWYYVEGRLACR